MTNIRLLTGLAGLRFSYAPGQIIPAPEDAAAWIAAGYAEPVDEDDSGPEPPTPKKKASKKKAPVGPAAAESADTEDDDGPDHS